METHGPYSERELIDATITLGDALSKARSAFERDGFVGPPPFDQVLLAAGFILQTAAAERLNCTLLYLGRSPARTGLRFSANVEPEMRSGAPPFRWRRGTRCP